MAYLPVYRVPAERCSHRRGIVPAVSAQVHCVRGKGVKVFSRTGEDVTLRYGRAALQLFRQCREWVTDIVLEGEAVAVDDRHNLLPFSAVAARLR